MKLLFVCSRNRQRSPTAETVFSAYEGVEALSAGTSVDSECPVSTELIEWADIIFVMDKVHRRKLNERFGSLLKEKHMVLLRIPDDYRYMQPELIQILKSGVDNYILNDCRPGEYL